MKPREMGGVVDARLNVYGVENLKIAGMVNFYFILRRRDLMQGIM